MELRPNIRIWLSTDDGHNVIGGGRYRLLQTVKELGSLSAAAEKLDISYRKAWDDLKKAEESIGHKLIIKHRGGSGGGKTELTPAGLKLLDLYETYAAKVNAFAADTYENLIKEISHEDD